MNDRFQKIKKKCELHILPVHIVIPRHSIAQHKTTHNDFDFKLNFTPEMPSSTNSNILYIIYTQIICSVKIISKHFYCDKSSHIHLVFEYYMIIILNFN